MCFGDTVVLNFLAFGSPYFPDELDTQRRLDLSFRVELSRQFGLEFT